MTHLQQIRPALTLFVILSVLTGLAYPFAMTGAAHMLFPHQANGSVMYHHEQAFGSELIGQNFTQARYFHGRPSATMGPDPSDASKTTAVPYNAAASVGSNAGPTSKALFERVQATVKQVKDENPAAIAAGMSVPMDLVMTSASGLDPDISPQAAFFQVKRIAHERGIAEASLTQLVERMTVHPWLGWLGEAHVNVLQLNVALDALRSR